MTWFATIENATWCHSEVVCEGPKRQHAPLRHGLQPPKTAGGPVGSGLGPGPPLRGPLADVCGVSREWPGV